MFSKVFLMAAAIAYVEARFGQEQVPIEAIGAVQGGDAGAAATIAGAAISDLLGGANSCDKLVRADQIFTELGGGADALAAAMGMVTAEKNTNPFANDNVQNVCGDASLPATPELRGITPLIDPDVDTDGAAAALSQSSAASPLDADGMSVFDLMDAAGLGNLVASQDSAGGAAQGGNQANNGNQQANNGNQQANNGNQQANNGNQQANNGNQQANNGTQQDGAAVDDQADNGNGNMNQQDAAAGNGTENAANDNNNNGNNQQNAGNNGNQQANGDNNGNNQQNAGNQGANNGNQGANTGNQQSDNDNNGNQSTATGSADFGLCTPTITFQGGENGRPADEFTFQIADPLARGGQSEALNPDIITNALCNQLTNVCEANDAAVAQCEDAQAQVKGGPRDKSTADTFNSLLGFDGAVTNPDGGPDDVAAAAAAAKRSMRRGVRA